MNGFDKAAIVCGFFLIFGWMVNLAGGFFPMFTEAAAILSFSYLVIYTVVNVAVELSNDDS